MLASARRVSAALGARPRLRSHAPVAAYRRSASSSSSRRQTRASRILGPSAAFFAGGTLLAHAAATEVTARRWRGQLSRRAGDPLTALLPLFGAIGGVFALWRVNPRLAARWFLDKANSKRLAPMLLAGVSHQGVLHLTFNCVGLYSFGSALQRWALPEEVYALFAGGVLAGSLASRANRVLTRSRTHALGASAGVLALIAVHALARPDSRVGLIFLPGFDIRADHALFAYTGAELLALLLRRRARLDHAAHLGGIAFGVLWWHAFRSWYQRGTRLRVRSR